MTTARQAIRVDGAQRLRRTLKAAGSDLADLKEVHAEVARIVADAARRRAPVGPDVNGHIRDTIRASGTSSAALVRAGYKRMPYAGVINYGWPNRNIKANPYLTSALNDTQPRWLNTYMRGVTKILANVQGA